MIPNDNNDYAIYYIQYILDYIYVWLYWLYGAQLRMNYDI